MIDTTTCFDESQAKAGLRPKQWRLVSARGYIVRSAGTVFDISLDLSAERGGVLQAGRSRRASGSATNQRARLAGRRGGPRPFLVGRSWPARR
jgi:hypothetical protein